MGAEERRTAGEETEVASMVGYCWYVVGMEGKEGEEKRGEEG